MTGLALIGGWMLGIAVVAIVIALLLALALTFVAGIVNRDWELTAIGGVFFWVALAFVFVFGGLFLNGTPQ